MAHDVTEAKARLEKLHNSETRRKHKDAAVAAGFDVLADYEAWQVLEDLRNATLKSRREIEEAERKKDAPKPTYTNYLYQPAYPIGSSSGLVSSNGRLTIGY